MDIGALSLDDIILLIVGACCNINFKVNIWINRENNRLGY